MLVLARLGPRFEKVEMMKRLVCAVMILGVSLWTLGCGPLTTAACDRVGVLCPNIDLAACDATVELVPPRTRSEIVSCTAAASTCPEAVACFSRWHDRQLAARGRLVGE